ARIPVARWCWSTGPRCRCACDSPACPAREPPLCLAFVIPDGSRARLRASEPIRDPGTPASERWRNRETWVPALAPKALGRDDNREAARNSNQVGYHCQIFPCCDVMSGPGERRET